MTSERDGHSADPALIYLTAGASSGVNTLMHIICAQPTTGILVPVPQYPLYTATLSLMNARCVPYYLDEAKTWSTDISSIRSALKQARAAGTDVRAIVVINPGNPTGASLPVADIKSIIEFAAEEKLVVLADEVYQTNIFEGEFLSFKKTLRDLQKNSDSDKYDHLELASLHSISKGMVGECGHRGGYMELVGFDEKVVAQIYKFVSISLCAPVIGQCLVECMVNPPKDGDESYPLYKKEYDAIFEGLKKRATALFDAFNEMEGVECQKPQVRKIHPPTNELFSGSLKAYCTGKTDRAQCTSTRPSTCPRRQRTPPQRKAANRTSSTCRGCWMPRGCAWSPGRDSDRRRGRYISGLRSWRRGRTGWEGLRSFIRSLWMSFGIDDG